MIAMKVFYYAGFKLYLENVTVLQVRILPTKNQRGQGGRQIVLKGCFQAQNQFPTIRPKKAQSQYGARNIENLFKIQLELIEVE